MEFDASTRADMAASTLELSAGQREVWREHALYPESALHTIGASTTILGPLKPETLECALRWVWFRHDALRLSPVPGPEGREPIQVEVETPARFLMSHDVASAADPTAAAALMADEFGRQAIPLDGSPTFRFHLIRIADDHHVWAMCYHHINMDAWANGILVRDVAAAYRAFAKGSEPALPPAPFYRDRVKADADFVTTERAKRNRDYWLDVHETAPDRVTDAVNGVLEGEAPPATALHRLSIDHDLLKRVRAAADRYEVPSARLYIAACLILFHLRSRARDIVFGMPVLNRPTARDKQTFGLCSVATAPRVEIDAGDNVATILRRLDRAMRGAMRHYRCPLSDIGRQLGQASGRVVQLFDINISHERVDYGEIAFGDAVGSVPRVLLNGVARTPVELFVREYGAAERVEVDLDLSLDAFDAETASSIASGYLAVLDWLSRGGIGGVSSAPLVSASERDWLLRGVNATARDHGAVEPVHRRIEAVSASCPDAVAVRFEGVEVSYGELNDRANALAHRLIRAGVGPESRVGVALERSVELVVGLLAVLKAGGAYLPLDLELPSDRLSFMMADASVDVVVTRAGLLDTLPAHGGRVVTVDGVGRGSRGGSGNPDMPLSAESLAYVIYTSGSTGRPKGVMNQHDGLWNRLRWMQSAFPIGPGDRVLQKTPFSFDVSVWEFFWPLMEGACLVVSRPGGHRDPDYLAEVLRREGVTVAHFVPSMLRTFLGHGPSASALGSCDALRYVFCSGEALPPPLVGEFLAHAPVGAGLHNLYGPTEAAIDVTHWPCAAPVADPLPIGQAISNTSLYVLDGALEPVPVGVVGELWIGGVQVSRGYLGRPGLTASSFMADPHGGVAGARMYRTGDLARRRSDGALVYLGRTDHQVKLRGFRIELGEIETALLGHGSVGAAAVLLREDRTGDPRLVAYVVAEGGVAPPDLLGHLRVTLAEHMVPSDVVVLDALPVTSNGKLDRGALPAPSAASGSGAGASRGPEEEVARSVFAGVLGREEVGPEDNFFALGGHSLLAVQAVGRLRAALHVDMPANAVFAAPSPREIAVLVRAVRGVELKPLPARASDSPRPASAAETRLWFLQRRDVEDTSYNMTGAVDLADGIDLVALARAMAAVWRRHQTLHGRFELREETLWVVPNPREMLTPVIEGPVTAEAAAAIEREEAETPFNLSGGPPARGRLLRLADGRARMILAFHHAGADARSVSVFGRDLDTAYFAATTDASLTVEDLTARLPEPIADALRAEEIAGRSVEVDTALERWRQRLSGIPAGLDLPWDGNRDDRGVVTTNLNVDISLRRRIARRAVTEGATVFMVLHAALAALLSRLSGQDDIVIGTPVDLRGDPTLDDTVGMLLNSVPLRLEIAAEVSGGELVAASRDTVTAALGDASVPLERIVAAADPEHRNTRAPIFQVLLTNHAPHLSELLLDGHVMAMRVVPQADAKMDLVVLCADDGTEIDITIENAAGLFSPLNARRFVGMLENFLVSLADHPEVPIGAIPLLDAAAAAVETRGADVADRRPAPDGDIPEAFQAMARDNPAAVAIEEADDRTLTYLALNDTADRIAAGLSARDVGRGDRVGLRMARGIDQITAMLGVLKAGAAYVPLDPEQPEPRLAGMAEDAGVALVITDEGTRAAAPSGVPFTELADSDAEAPVLTLTGADTAYVMFTSGSTGRPKGIAIPHRAVLRLAIDPGFADFRVGKRVAQVATTAFDAATYEIWCALLNGGTTVVIDRAATYEAESLAAAFRATRVQSTFLTASVFNRAARAEADAFSGFEEVMFGGEAADASAVRTARARWPEIRFVNGYGPTETTTFAACHWVGDMAPEDVTVPIGRPIRSTALYVLDGGMNPVPRGVSGELYLGGTGLADGYVGDPARSAANFIADPFSGVTGARMYRTGDLVRRDPDGAVVYLGRMDRQIKLRGFRIEPGEIEVKLGGLLDDSAEVVVDARVSDGDRALFAWVIGRRVDATEERRLRAGLSARLPGWMLPRRILGVDTPPLSPNGKLDRRALKVPEGAPAVVPTIADLPDTRTERRLAELWSGLLDGATVGRTDGFFAVGGHSLMGVRLVSRVREAFGVDLPLRAVFETPTLSEMSAVIDDLAREETTGQEVSITAMAWPDDTRPVAPNQVRLALMDRIDGSGIAYTVPVTLLVDGPVDPDALGTALRALALRHEPLRTVISVEDHLVSARVLSPDALSFTVVEQGPCDLGAARTIVADVARAEAARPFLLDEEPPMRARVLRFGDERAGIVLTLHHIAFDGQSEPILTRDLARLYQAALAGNMNSAVLPALPAGYADWIGWAAEERLRGVDEVEHARAALASGPEVLALPLDRPRPARRDHKGGIAEFSVPADMEVRIQERARALGSTPFALLTAAFALLLARLSGENDIVLGVPVAGRSREECQDLIGFFADTAVLRVRLDEEPDGDALVARVQADLTRVLADAVPFDALVEALDVRRDTSHGSVFQAMIALHDERPAPALFGEAEAEMLLVHPGTAKFDIQLQILRDGETLRGALEYATDVIDPSTARSFASRFILVLDWLSRGGIGGVSSAPLVSASERDWLLRGVNATARDHGAVEPVHRRIEAVSASCPDAVAVRFEGVEVSYGELNDRANALAHRLIRAGVGPESRVGVALERSVELVVGLLAVLKAGGAYLPLDLELPSDRLSFMMADASVDVVVTRAGLLDTLPAHGGRVVTVDGVGRRSRGGSGNPDVPLSAESLAYVIYTSGSTGRPKGVMNQHDGLWNRLRWMQSAFPIGPGDRVLQKTPFSFDVSVWEFFWPLMEGACLVVSRPGGHRDPDYLAEVLRREGVTVAHFVPSMLRTFLGHGPSALALGSCDALRYVFCSGEALPSPLVGDFLAHAPVGAGLHNLYGPTEAAIDVTHWPCAAPVADPLPIGQAISNTSLYVLDGALEPVPVGVVGELWIGGVQVSRGYLGRPGLTASNFMADPHGGVAGARMYRTGDLARRRPDGALVYLGRTDHQVKLRGFRIELGEIETALLGHGSVLAAAVLLREDRTGDPRLVAYVVAEGGVAPPDLLGHLRVTLAEHMVPSDVVVLDALPVTSNGKLDRGALPAPSVASGSGAGASRGPEEEVARSVFAGVLGREEVGPEDNFFALGGHSLLAVQAVGRLRAALHVDMPANAVFENPTPRRIAELARSGRVGAGTMIGRRLDDATILPSLGQRQLWFLCRLEGSKAYNVPDGFIVDGPLDIIALSGAVEDIMSRHEALRAVMLERDGEPVVEVLAPPSVRIGVDRLVTDDPAELDSWFRRQSLHSFKIDIEPPIRLAVASLRDGRHAIAIVMHHLATDGASAPVLYRDLSDAYAARKSGRRFDREDPPLGYYDWAMWQRDRAASGSMEAAVERVRARLASAPDTLELPVDFQRPDAGSFDGAMLRVAIPIDLSAALRGCARETGSTLFMVLAAGLGAFLGRLCDQEDLVIGAPVSGRDRAETESLVGFMVNTIPLRLRPVRSTTLAEFLDATRNDVLASFADGDLPLDRVVQALSPNRVHSRTPLFQVLLALQPADRMSLELDQASVTPVNIDTVSARYDLTFAFDDDGRGLDLVLHYAADLFREDTARMLVDGLNRVLRALADDRSKSIRDLDLLDHDGRCAETSGLDVRDLRAAPDGDLVSRFRQIATEHAGRPAVEEMTGATRTYQELDTLSDRVAAGLRQAGVRRGDRIGLFMERGGIQVAAMLAVLKAGGAYVPLEPELPTIRLSMMLDAADVRIVVCDQSLPGGGFAGATDVRSLAVDTLMKAEITGADGDDAVRDGAEVAYVPFISGVSGQPMGVPISDRAILRSAVDPGFTDVTSGRRVAYISSAASDAVVHEIWAPLLNGGVCVVVNQEGATIPAKLGESMSVQGIDSLYLTSAMFSQAAASEINILGDAREVLVGGGAVDVEAARAAITRWPSVRFVHVHGTMETAGVASFQVVEIPTSIDLSVPIGRPSRATSLYVLDQDLNPVPRGGHGELYVGGEGLADGYLRAPARTAESFLADPFTDRSGARMYRTRELVRRRGDGALEYLGRLDRRLRLQGHWVDPSEIEVAIRARTPNAAEVFVDVLAPDDVGAENEIVAWVTGPAIDPERERELRSDLSVTLPAWMVPARVIGLEALPIGRDGKVDRALLPLLGTGGEVAVPRKEIETETEKALAEIWSGLLNGAPVEADDTFFDVGGHSLLGVKLVALVRQRLGVTLELRAVFEHSGLREMARLIDRSREDGATNVPTIKRRARRGSTDGD